MVYSTTTHFFRLPGAVLAGVERRIDFTAPSIPTLLIRHITTHMLGNTHPILGIINRNNV